MYSQMDEVCKLMPILWINPGKRDTSTALSKLELNERDMEEAERRWRKFAPLIEKLFPETQDMGGIIESKLVNIPEMKSSMEGMYGIPVEGNLFFDMMLGADIKFITGEEYKNNRAEIMEGIKEELEKKGHKGYIIPEGASNGIGSLGYINAMEEILKQEGEMGVKFDAIAVTVGSGGTYSGLYYGNRINNNSATVYGFNITETKEHFQEVVVKLLKEISQYTGKEINVTIDEIDIIDGYVGRGYALSRPEEIEFLSYLAKLEGLILDPVYTGKAMYGLVEEIKKGKFDKHENILFIHTGGIFGWNVDQRSLLK